MKILKYIYCLVLFGNLAIAQNKIPGSYDPVSRTFETDNKTYWIDFFIDGSANIYKEGYVGLIDSTGTILCEPKYDEVFRIDETAYRISLNNKYGLMDNKGNETRAPFTPEQLDFSLGLAVYKENNLYGILKKDGGFLTKAKYKSLIHRKGKGYLYSNKDEIGFINYKGKKIIVYDKNDIKEAILDKVIINDASIVTQLACSPKGYFSAGLLEFSEGFAVAFKKIGTCYKYGFMNENFETVIAPAYDWVEKFSNGYAIVSENGKWGIINSKGVLATPCIYDSIVEISKNRFRVYLNGKYGVVDNENNIVINIKYNPIFALDNNLYAMHDGKKWGALNEKEELVLPFEFDGIRSGVASKYEGGIPLPTGSIQETSFGSAYYFDKFGKLKNESFKFALHVRGRPHDYFLLNPDYFLPDKINIKGEYRIIDRLANGYKIVAVKEQGKEILYQENNFNNNIIYDNNIMYQKNNNNKNIIGYIVTGNNYNHIRYYYHNHLIIPKKGIADHKNQIIIPLVYEDIRCKEVNLLVAKKEGKYGVIDLKNNIIIPFKYEFIEMGNGYFIITKERDERGNYRSAVYDFFGNTLIPFSSARYSIFGAGVLEKDEGYPTYFIDKKGNKINKN